MRSRNARASVFCARASSRGVTPSRAILPISSFTSCAIRLGVCPGFGVTMIWKPPSSRRLFWNALTSCATCMSYTSRLYRREFLSPASTSASDVQRGVVGVEELRPSATCSTAAAAAPCPRARGTCRAGPADDGSAGARRQLRDRAECRRSSAAPSVFAESRWKSPAIDERRVVRRVVRPEEVLHVLERRRADRSAIEPIVGQ